MIILLSQAGYIAISVLIIVILLAAFVLSFYLYKKTPEPKNSIFKNKEMCQGCSQSSCIYKNDEYKEEKKNGK